MSDIGPAQTKSLFPVNDLQDVGSTGGLAQSDLDALQTVGAWIKAFIAKQHDDLGRAGPVCPFVPGALPDARLAANHQHGALPGAGHVEQPVEHAPLVAPAAQLGRGSLPTDASPTIDPDGRRRQDQGVVRKRRGGRGANVRTSHIHERSVVMYSSQPTPEGPASVSGAPNLPIGFTDTFESRSVDSGEVRLHAVVGGDGPPLLLIHGWPGSWYYWRLVMPALARDFTVVAVDQRGIGLSDKPEGGYDTATLANDMVGLMDALGHERFAVVGVDTGLLIGYALAADHPDRVVRVALGEAPLPGITPPTPLILPDPVVDRLWHIPFNQLKETNEKLVRGREDVFFGAEFAASAGTNKLSAENVRYYVDGLASSPEALHGSFQLYRPSA
jgi:hypothetical protein